MSSSSSAPTAKLVGRGRVLRGAAASVASGSSLGHASIAHLAPLDAAAAAVVEEAATEARRLAHEQGFAAGLADGMAEADERIRTHEAARTAACDRAMQAAAAAAADLRSRHAVALAEIEDAVVELAFELATAVVGRELELAASPGRDAVARALALAPPAGPATVRLHPVDADTIGSMTDLAPGRDVVVVPDGSVEPAGCIVEVGACTVDAQISTALERAREALAR